MKLRKLVQLMFLAGALSVFGGMTASAEAVPEEEEIVCSASAAGINGEVTVEVVATADELVSVTVTDHSETAGIGAVAAEELPAKMVDEQLIDVDDMTGATIISTAIKTAVKDALESAGLDASVYDGFSTCFQRKEGKHLLYHRRRKDNIRLRRRRILELQKSRSR